MKTLLIFFFLSLSVFAADTISAPKNTGKAYFTDTLNNLMPLVVGYSTDGNGNLVLLNSPGAVDDNISIPKGQGKMYLNAADGKQYPAMVLYTTDGNGHAIPIPAGGGGTVTGVTASLPLFSSGGSAPDITIQNASAIQTGALTSTDWSTFNSKEPAITTLPIAKGGTNSSTALTNNKLMTGITGSIVEAPNSEIGVLDAFSRKKLWYYDTDSIFKLGSWQTDGDATNANSEGAVIYGVSVTGGAINAGNGGYARIKANRFGLFTIDSTLPAYAGGDYYYRVDPTSLYLKDNNAVKTFEVTRTTGNIKTSMGAGVVVSDASGNLTASTQYLKKGALSIFVIDNGEYATGQDAINAAPAGSVLFFGPKVGTWGNIALKPDVDIVGLGAPGSTNILFQSISFSPTTGNVSQNTVYVSNISASVGSGSPTITIGGTAPSRVRFSGCTFYKTAGTEDAVSITNNQSTSSVYFTDSQLNGTGSTGSLINTVSPFLKVVNVTFDGANKALTQTAGLTTLDKADIEYAQTASIIDVVGGSVISADSLFRNLGTNSTGVNVSLGATFAIDQATFDVSTGTGYAVNGTGVLAYGRVTFADIPIINPRNVKFQNTLTIANYTLTPTLAP